MSNADEERELHQIFSKLDKLYRHYALSIVRALQFAQSHTHTAPAPGSREPSETEQRADVKDDLQHE